MTVFIVRFYPLYSLSHLSLLVSDFGIPFLLTGVHLRCEHPVVVTASMNLLLLADAFHSMLLFAYEEVDFHRGPGFRSLWVRHHNT